METQADRCRAWQDDARLREARDRRPEGRPRLRVGAHEAGECLAFPAAPAQSIASPSLARAATGADHSHPDSYQNLSPGKTRSADASTPHARGTEKPAIAVSPELAAYVARRTT